MDLADSDGGLADLGIGLGALASVGSLLDDDGEDPETKRRRREAEQNGSDLGAAIGLGIDLIAAAVGHHLPGQMSEEPINDPALTLGGL